MADSSSTPPSYPVVEENAQRAPQQLPESGLIAPAWHTAIVLILLLGVAALSAWKGSAAADHDAGGYGRLLNYATVFVWEWLTVGFIVWGLRMRGVRVGALISGAWPDAQAFLRDLLTAVVFLLVSDLILAVVQLAMRNMPNRALRDLLPQTSMEAVAWLALAATAGFCEELIFRGYLQNQFARMLKSAPAALVLQAIVFGLCHGYQGVKSVVTITLYGAMFGLLAQRQRSLRPGMITHFLQDGVFGLVAREALKYMPKGLA
jgi:uncharacterized protein